MLSVDLVVYYDQKQRAEGALFGADLEGLEINLTPHFVAETYLLGGSLEDGSALPQQAVVLVHGGMISRYVNVSHIRELSARRTDLRFVVSVDRDQSGEGAFANPLDYRLIREALEHDCSPAFPISVTPYNLAAFIEGMDLGRSIEENLVQYLQRWKGLKEGGRV